ncbi:DNA topoisomerase [Burkholderia multivorans]|uniref:DNA topoisomerase n=1 Tax=Burkholderia multivorans TaxID=87883 RepID=UPI001C25033B|nr:DNA topoisomerase [Burkholderia multivorans]MBU9413516.1 topoisomerase DNA-binding C4 zinc finger domain-containing protein [Burkholderia multivorans]
MKALILAEKPSVAGDIAAALGGFSQVEKNLFERDDLAITSAAGHLVEIAAPEAIAHLTPVIPERFALVAREAASERLKAVLRQLRRSDVGSLINACDAGREGELIFRLIVEFAQSCKPVRRMWLQSMTPQAIRDSFAAQRSDEQMQPLAAAARARAEADWIVGINGSRLCRRLTGVTTPVGRVQTPTLMLVVAREEAIRTFEPRIYHEVHLTVALQAGEFVARWQDPDRGTSATSAANGPGAAEAGAAERRERIWNVQQASAIAARCAGRDPELVTDDTQPSVRSAPALFDLTTLQREANRLYGLSAKQTLDLAQILYQNHKVLTYPRTDAKALPEDYVPTITKIIGTLADGPYVPQARRVLDNGWIRPVKRIFDNAKIRDHFAIVPTGTSASGLSEAEWTIYDLVVRRTLAAFYPDAEFAVTTRSVELPDDVFVARGQVLVKPGWLAVYRGEGDDKGERAKSPALPALKAGETGRNAGVSVVEGKTRAPARYTEATLLSAMEHAGREVEDEALREVMAERGLGTPATRAATIEGLLADGYLERQKKLLVPTARAVSLRKLLVMLQGEALLSPILTGEWESQLRAIERNEVSAAGFRTPVEAFVRALAKRTDAVEAAVLAGNPPCPSCGRPLRRVVGKHGPFWSCSTYPDCSTVLPDEQGRPGQPRPKPVVSQFTCTCGAGLVQRTGTSNKTHKPYSLWSCSAYPKCRLSWRDRDGQPDITCPPSS